VEADWYGFAGNTVAFGEYGLQSLERCWLDTKQIEAARVAVTRYMKRRGRSGSGFFPTIIYKKAVGNTNGQGQRAAGIMGGCDPSGLRSCLRVDGVPEAVARESMRLAATTANQDQVHFEAQAWLMGI